MGRVRKREERVLPLPCLCPWQTLLMDHSTFPGSHGPSARLSWPTGETSLLHCLQAKNGTRSI